MAFSFLFVCLFVFYFFNAARMCIVQYCLQYSFSFVLFQDKKYSAQTIASYHSTENP